jgi:hypothetical protein
VRWNSPFSIGIDTGAVYGGKLTAIRLPDESIFRRIHFPGLTFADGAPHGRLRLALHCYSVGNEKI